MRLLQRNAPKVTTRYGGSFVQSIDGISGGGSGGTSDWFFYVNGIEADKGATSIKVHQGDRIWWDYRDWGVTDDIPAVVGSFPEPFLHGVDGPPAADARGVRGSTERCLRHRRRQAG